MKWKTLREVLGIYKKSRAHPCVWEMVWLGVWDQQTITLLITVIDAGLTRFRSLIFSAESQRAEEMDKWAITQKSHNLKEQHAGRTWVEERYFGSQTGLQGQFYIVFGECIFEGSHRYRHTHKTVNKEFLFVQSMQLRLVPLVKLLPKIIIIIIIILSHLFRSNLLCSKWLRV